MKQETQSLILLRMIAQYPNQKAGFYAEKLNTHRVGIHKSLSLLFDQGYIEKHGVTPHTIYSITQKSIDTGVTLLGEDSKKNITPSGFIPLSYHDTRYIHHFYKYLPDGSLLTGKEGLQLWAEQRGIDPALTFERFARIARHIDELRNEIGLLDATKSFHQGRHSQAMDELFFIDQYIYGEFGRGPLAELAFYAKLSQNKKLVQELIDKIIDPIISLAHTKDIDAIALIPPSIDRKYQLLEIIGAKLAPMQIPFIPIYKYFPNRIPIAQKTLKTKEQREQNAKSSIQIPLDTSSYNRVLLLDDFVGSGATLDITANKLKIRGIAKYVVGLALIGNLDLKYEVISEI